MGSRSDATMVGQRFPLAILQRLREDGNLPAHAVHGQLIKYAVARCLGDDVETARAWAMSGLPRPTGKPYGPRKPKAPVS